MKIVWCLLGQVAVQMSVCVQYMWIGLFDSATSFIAPQFTVWQKLRLGLPKAGRWASS